jgi:hypothetical protein
MDGDGGGDGGDGRMSLDVSWFFKALTKAASAPLHAQICDTVRRSAVLCV